MAFAETLSDFINTDTPGYGVAVIGGVSGTCLFDDAYIDPLGISSSAPAIHIIADDFAAASPALAYGSSITVDSVAYTVTGIEPDGHGGITVLRLQDAA